MESLLIHASGLVRGASLDRTRAAGCPMPAAATPFVFETSRDMSDLESPELKEKKETTGSREDGGNKGIYGYLGSRDTRSRLPMIFQVPAVRTLTLWGRDLGAG